jgi:hypothetical protein
MNVFSAFAIATLIVAVTATAVEACDHAGGRGNHAQHDSATSTATLQPPIVSPSDLFPVGTMLTSDAYPQFYRVHINNH